MNTERFDQTIMSHAQRAADDLLKDHPELRSIAVIVDWNLPGAAVDVLPVGTLRTRDDHKEAHLKSVTSLTCQTVRFVGSLQTELLNSLKATHAALSDKSGTQEPASDAH